MVHSRKLKGMPSSVWRLMIAYALMMAGTSLNVLIAGIIGIEFAPHRGLATLPIACSIVGVATATLPTGKFLQRWGRRRVFVEYGGLAISAALLAAFSLVAWSFTTFCLAAFLIGWSAAAGHQYRFAALEKVPLRLAPRATSVLLFGGMLAAFIGPEIAVRGRGLIGTPFAGSYLLLALAYSLGAFIVSLNSDSMVESAEQSSNGRPLSEIVRTPVIILSVCAAGLGYGVMSFLMTATPINMHQYSGHGLESTKLVIQAHIVAMYLPSLMFASLLAMLGFRRMLTLGVVALLACLGVAWSGTALTHYFIAMVLLGIGWNFLFLGGTNMLVYGYRQSERFRVQSANDFMVFSVQALVSLGSGWFLFQYQWKGLIIAVFPLVALFAVLLWRSRAFAEIDRA